MVKNNSLISIVVPCYNVAHYISRCLDSIVSQSYKRIEIILVNDGSTDGTEDIIKEYAKTDARMTIINQKNQGLSGARNTGLKHAKGEYICFIDSDDFIATEYLQKMHNAIIKDKSDICACGFYYINEYDELSPRASIQRHKIFDSTSGIADLFTEAQYTSVTTWNKLYKTDLFKEHRIIFPEGKIHEDNFTTYKLYYFSKKISYIPNRLYYYMQRSNSIMGRGFDPQHSFDLLDAYEETRKFFQEHGFFDKIKDYLICYEANIYVELLNRMVRAKYAGQKKEDIIQSIRMNQREYLLNPHLSKKLKYAIKIICLSPQFYALAIKLKRSVA